MPVPDSKCIQIPYHDRYDSISSTYVSHHPMSEYPAGVPSVDRIANGNFPRKLPKLRGVRDWRFVWMWNEKKMMFAWMSGYDPFRGIDFVMQQKNASLRGESSTVRLGSS